MPIAVECVCGRRLLAPDQFAGTRAPCPSCGRTLDIPLLAAVSPAPQSHSRAGDESVRVEPPQPIDIKQFFDPPKAAPPPKPRTVSLAQMARACSIRGASI